MGTVEESEHSSPGKSDARTTSSATIPDQDRQERERPQAESTKATEILSVCRDFQNFQTLEPLISLATSSHGLLNDETRQIACMIDANLSECFTHLSTVRAFSSRHY